jgi:hypothetical protein
MIDNPIVDEIHRIREEMLAEYGGDLHALIVNAQDEAARAGRRVIAPPPQTIDDAAPRHLMNPRKPADPG